MTDETRIDLQWIFAAIRHWLWLILGFTLFVTALTFFITSRMPLTYKSSVTLLVSSNEATAQNEYSELVAGEKLTFTFSEMLKSKNVLEGVIQKLNLTKTPEELEKNISAEPVKNTQLIILNVTGDSPEQAMQLANAVAEAFKSEVKNQLSGRYAGFLLGKQQEMDGIESLIDDTQTEIDRYSSQQIDAQAKLVRLESNLTDLRNEYRSMQQSRQELNLTVALLKEKIKIIEKAKISDGSPYLATVTLLLNFGSDLEGNTNYSTEPLITTYGNLVKSQPVLQEAIDKLGLNVTPEFLSKQISINPVRDTQLLEIGVTDNNNTQAMLLADTIAEVYIEHVKGIQVGPYEDQIEVLLGQTAYLSTQISEIEEEIEGLTTTRIQAETALGRLEKLQSDYREDYRTVQQEYEQLRLTVASSADSVTINSPARLPTKPVQSQVFIVLLAIILSFLTSMGIAFVLEQSNDRFRSVEDIRHLLPVNILGKVGYIPPEENGLAIVSDRQSATAEALRIIATNLRLGTKDQTVGNLIVSSPSAGEGKSIIAANLAVAMAETGLKVVLVDADLMVPTQNHYFPTVNRSPGLSEALADGEVVEKLQPSKVERLQILTSGDNLTNISELYHSSNWERLLQELKNQSDVVLIDCPPLLPVAYSKMLAAKVDGVLLTIRAGKTTRSALQDVMENIQQVHAKLIGVIVNDPNRNRPISYQGYSYGKMSMPQSVREHVRSIYPSLHKLFEKKPQGS